MATANRPSPFCLVRGRRAVLAGLHNGQPDARCRRDRLELIWQARIHRATELSCLVHSSGCALRAFTLFQLWEISKSPIYLGGPIFIKSDDPAVRVLM